MYPIDRIQQGHARQTDLLENLTAIIQDYPNSTCIRDETRKFIFYNALFHESLLTQDRSAEKWFLSQRDFYELISVAEMEAYRNEHTHLNLVEGVFTQNRFQTISVWSFPNGHRNIIPWQFHDAAHVRHKGSYNQKMIVSDDIRNIIRRVSDDSSVSSYVNDVFYLYGTGISHNAIARILNISIFTSKKHASLACGYFFVSNKGELIILFYNKKFIYYLYKKAMCIINTRQQGVNKTQTLHLFTSSDCSANISGNQKTSSGRCY